MTERPVAAGPVADRGGPGPTGILAALPEEMAPMLARLEPVQAGGGSGARRRHGQATGEGPEGLRLLRRGRLAGVGVALGVTGDGRRHAERGVAAFLDAVSPRNLVVIGSAAGLVDGLTPGVLLAARAVWRAGAPTLCASSELLERLDAVPGVRKGVVATVDRILDTPEAKREVARELYASGFSGVDAAADLESGHYAAVAEARGVPWVVLRSISDGVSEGLPSLLNECRDEGGGVRRSQVARRLLFRPATTARLLRLRARVKDGGEALAEALERVLAHERAPQHR